MWLSRKFSLQHRAQQEGAATDMGVTTIGGSAAAVMTRGEQRELSVFAPGGLLWQPRAGDTVLVVKGGVGCVEQCVVAAENAALPPAGMVPGEMYLYSADGAAAVYLKNDGSIAVTGNVAVEGQITVMGPVTVEGDLTVEGTVSLTGAVRINGDLTINGEPYKPCRCSA